MIEPDKTCIYTVKILEMKTGEVGMGVESLGVNRVWTFNFKTGNVNSSEDGMIPYSKSLPEVGS